MKKNLLILLFVFVSAILMAFAGGNGGVVKHKVSHTESVDTFPVKQFLGNKRTNVIDSGGFTAQTVILINFADTTAANLAPVKDYPGALIRTNGDVIWKRNSTATGWSELASGSSINIYNSDGSLTGNRQVLGGASYNLTFDGMQLFGVTASSISLTSGISTVNISDSVVFDNTQGFSIRTLSSDDDTTTYKPLGYDPITGTVVTRSSWVGSGGGDSSIFATIYRTDTLSQNLRNEIGLRWSLTGNSGALIQEELQPFLGTTDNYPLIFRVENVLGGYIGSSNQNVSLGKNAFRELNLTTYGFTGIKNIAIGESAGFSKKTGDDDVLIGHEAAFYGAGGVRRIVIGNGALERDTSGSDQVVIGYQAQTSTNNDSFWTTSYVTAIGNYAGLDNKLSNTVHIDDGNALGDTTLERIFINGNNGFGYWNQSLIVKDSAYIKQMPQGGVAADSVVVIDANGKLKKRNSADFSGGGGSGTVTSVGTGYGLSGGTITTSGTLLLDSATVANYFMRRKDSLTTSNALGYVTKKTLADTAAALRSLTSYITIDKRYDSLAWRRNDSTLDIKSLRVQAYGTTVTPTVTDSSLSYNITVAPPTKQSVTSTSDTIHLVNDSTTLTNTKVYGYSSGTRGWKDAINVTLTSPTNLQTLVYSSGTFINGNKVDTIYRTAGKDSIIFLMSGVRFAIKDSTGGGGATPAGNYGNVQLNRNSALATPASDSLNFTAGSGLNVKGKYLINGTQALYIPDQTSFASTMYVGNGGGSLSHSAGLEGQYNFYAGMTAGNANTSGASNTGVGARTLQGLTTGTNTTAFGSDAMYSFVTGTNNTAVGKSAMQSANGVNYNTGVGYNALFSVSGSFNTAIGAQAGENTTSGTNNLYIGLQSGLYNKTGGSNTYIGSTAGLGASNQSNSNNTAVGYAALTAITTGGNNIAIGYQAANAVTSGANNIVIGYDIDPVSNTASNQMTIGNAIFGTGISGTGTTAAGKIGILNNAPDSTFDVTGGMKTSGGVRFTGLPNGGSSSADSLIVATSAGQLKKINPSIFAPANVESSYTPTLTNTTNIAASTAYTTYYIRIGSTIHVWGTVDIDATTALSVCEMGFSLPVATISQIYDVGGTAAYEDNTSVQIKGDVGNARAVWRFTPQTASNNKYSFHFTYKYSTP